MGNIFKPDCALPSYLLPSQEMVRTCGRFYGLLVGVTIGSIVCFAAISKYGFFEKPKDSSVERKTSNAHVPAMLACIAGSIVFLSWLLGGRLAMSRNENQDAEVASFERTGMSHNEAVKEVQELENFRLF